MVVTAADGALPPSCHMSTEHDHRERARLSALRRCAILDTPPEACFDRITKMAAHLLATPIALISLVDHDRQWFKSRHGLELREIVAGELPVRDRGPRRCALGGAGCARRSPLCRQPAGQGPAAHPLLCRRAADHRRWSSHRRLVRHRPRAAKPVTRAPAPAGRSGGTRGRMHPPASVQPGPARRDRLRARTEQARRERAPFSRFRPDRFRLVLGDGRASPLLLVLGSISAPDRRMPDHTPGPAPRRGRTARSRRRRLGCSSRRPGGAAPVSGFRLRLPGSRRRSVVSPRRAASRSSTGRAGSAATGVARATSPSAGRPSRHCARARNATAAWSRRPRMASSSCSAGASPSRMRARSRCSAPPTARRCSARPRCGSPLPPQRAELKARAERLLRQRPDRDHGDRAAAARRQPGRGRGDRRAHVDRRPRDRAAGVARHLGAQAGGGRASAPRPRCSRRPPTWSRPAPPNTARFTSTAPAGACSGSSPAPRSSKARSRRRIPRGPGG